MELNLVFKFAEVRSTVWERVRNLRSERSLRCAVPARSAFDTLPPGLADPRRLPAIRFQVELAAEQGDPEVRERAGCLAALGVVGRGAGVWAPAAKADPYAFAALCLLYTSPSPRDRG